MLGIEVPHELAQKEYVIGFKGKSNNLETINAESNVGWGWSQNGGKFLNGNGQWLGIIGNSQDIQCLYDSKKEYYWNKTVNGYHAISGSYQDLISKVVECVDYSIVDCGINSEKETSSSSEELYKIQINSKYNLYDSFVYVLVLYI